eukprot:gene11619-8007_t
MERERNKTLAPLLLTVSFALREEVGVLVQTVVVL